MEMSCIFGYLDNWIVGSAFVSGRRLGAFTNSASDASSLFHGELGVFDRIKRIPLLLGYTLDFE